MVTANPVRVRLRVPALLSRVRRVVGRWLADKDNEDTVFFSLAILIGVACSVWIALRS